MGSATEAAWSTGDPAEALVNAVPYMQAFGHTVLAWLWLDVALASLSLPPDAPHAGRMGAMRYFYHYELPKIDAWLKVVESRDLTCAELPEDLKQEYGVDLTPEIKQQIIGGNLARLLEIDVPAKLEKIKDDELSQRRSEYLAGQPAVEVTDAPGTDRPAVDTGAAGTESR